MFVILTYIDLSCVFNFGEDKHNHLSYNELQTYDNYIIYQLHELYNTLINSSINLIIHSRHCVTLFEHHQFQDDY